MGPCGATGRPDEGAFKRLLHDPTEMLRAVGGTLEHVGQRGEWSKAPDLGSGPYGRGFEPHRCHLSNGNDAACEWYPILAALTVGIFLFSVQPTHIHSKVKSVHCSLYKGSQRGC